MLLIGFELIVMDGREKSISCIYRRFRLITIVKHDESINTAITSASRTTRNIGEGEGMIERRCGSVHIDRRSPLSIMPGGRIPGKIVVGTCASDRPPAQVPGEDA